MLRRTVPFLGMCSLDMSLGSKGQKHMLLAPTPFLYRFVYNDHLHPKEKHTVRLANSWWGLGCYPSGREVPMRLDEFRENYIASHVPEEVEEWLEYLMEHPVKQCIPALTELVRELEKIPAPRERSWKKAECFRLEGVMPSVKRLCETFHLPEIAPLCVRGVCMNKSIKEELMDTAYDLSLELAETGSTTYRRWGRLTALNDGKAGLLSQSGEEDSAQTVKLLTKDSSSKTTALNADTEAAAGKLLADVYDVPTNAAKDEKLALRLLTLFAQGAHEMKNYDVAEKVLDSASIFAPDDETEGVWMANQSAVKIGVGKYKEAESLAKEAVLRVQSPRAYANWAVSTALLDRHDEALKITAEALAMFPESTELQETHQNLLKAMGGRTAIPEEMRGKRTQTTFHIHQGTRRFPAAYFEHEWARGKDQKGKDVNPWLDVTRVESSHAGRRVYIPGFKANSSNPEY